MTITVKSTPSPVTPKPPAAPRQSRSRGVAHRVAGSLVTFTVSVVAILAIWTAFIAVIDVSPFVAKTPLDIWQYLITDDAAAEHRNSILQSLTHTLGNAALSYLLGMGAAASVTLVFYFTRILEDMFLPTVTALSTIPTITFAPILVLIFGRETLGVAVIGAVVVFVPALLLMIQGIHTAPKSDVLMCRAFGGSPWAIFRKVSLPHAVPTWIMAARIAVTTSVIGALLGEWLASGEGLGGQMLSDANTFEFDRLWAAVAILTVTCIALYNIAGIAEKAVNARLSLSQ